jgi:DNA-binding MarR family transcriptional regulator
MTNRIAEEHLAAWRALLNVHARLIERIERALTQAGLPPLSWYDVLWALYSTPGKSLRMGQLAENVTISRSGLTRLVDRIESAGMLERRPAAGDRRAVEVAITAEGSRLIRRMWPVYESVLLEHFEGELSHQEARALRDTLGRLH